MSEERRKMIYEKKKELYLCNKKLLEIDPNLIIQIKLKYIDAFSIVNLLTLISYMLIFKRTNKTKKKILHSAVWLIAQFNVRKYYYTVYPFILLKNTQEVLGKNQALNTVKTL